jgi:two-component system nitrogen regulation response regulator GlnG
VATVSEIAPEAVPGAATVLVADDDQSIRTVLHQALARQGHVVRTISSASALWQRVESGEGDLLITDVVFPDGDALALLPRIRARRPALPVIVMSARSTFLTALRASECGAIDYLPKPFDLNALIEAVERALTPSADVNARPLAPAEDDMPIIGRSAAMQDIFRAVARLRNTDLTVLINGESGTGKELIAHALHDYGRRRAGSFVAINMAAIPHELIESELFGHEKGAFTGAAARHAGRFEEARGGTLFLDEVGDMPLDTQTRLLRVLQSGTFMRVGGRETIHADARIIAATHRNLRQMVAQGLFREDLFFRLNVVPIRVPALRERLGDIPLLVRSFLARAVAADGLPEKTLSPEALARLKEHDWPGNVRELENLIRRLAALHPDDELGRDAINAALAEAQPRHPSRGSGQENGDTAGANSNESLTFTIERHLSQYFATHGDALPPPGLYDRVLREMERPLLMLALNAAGGNQLKAAALLGLNRNTLRKKLRALDIRTLRGPS